MQFPLELLKCNDKGRKHFRDDAADVSFLLLVSFFQE